MYKEAFYCPVKQALWIKTQARWWANDLHCVVLVVGNLLIGLVYKIKWRIKPNLFAAAAAEVRGSECNWMKKLIIHLSVQSCLRSLLYYDNYFFPRHLASSETLVITGMWCFYGRIYNKEELKETLWGESVQLSVKKQATTTRKTNPKQARKLPKFIDYRR